MENRGAGEDEEDVDEEFDELLGGNLEDGYTDDDQEDVYENEDDNSVNYYRQGIMDVERKTSSSSTNYVPSPAPGSFPRNRSSNGSNNVNGFIAMRDPYDTHHMGGSNVATRRVVYNQKGSKNNGRSKGSYFV